MARNAIPYKEIATTKTTLTRLAIRQRPSAGTSLESRCNAVVAEVRIFFRQPYAMTTIKAAMIQKTSTSGIGALEAGRSNLSATSAYITIATSRTM